MSKQNVILKTFPLSGTKNGSVTVSHIEEPYGASSHSVVSIGISLGGNLEEPDWKAHVPYEDLGNLIDALLEAKAKYGK